jgi:hypothetical protein
MAETQKVKSSGHRKAAGPSGWGLLTVLVLGGILFLTAPALAQSVHNFCPNGTCTLQQAVVTNLYWDTSLALWDADVATAATTDMAHGHIDDLVQALLNSGTFGRLSQYNASFSGNVGTSIAAGGCAAVPSNIAGAKNNVGNMVNCILKIYPNLNNGNTILAVFLPPQVGPSSGWCSGPGSTAGEHDEYGTPVEIAILPTNKNCSKTLNALLAITTHELAEAVTDPNPSSPTGWRDEDPFSPYVGKEIGDLCQPPVINAPLVNFLFGQVQPYWSQEQNSCVIGSSPNPPLLNGPQGGPQPASAYPPSSVCGTGPNMVFTLSGVFLPYPWDLAAKKFGNQTLYANLQVQHQGKTWEAGNFEGLPNTAVNGGRPDVVNFGSNGVSWHQNTITISGFDNHYGQALANGAVAKVSPGDSITVQIASPDNGLWANAALTAPSASQSTSLVVTPNGANPWVSVNETAEVTGQVTDNNNCVVEEDAIQLGANLGSVSPGQVSDDNNGQYQGTYHAPAVAGFDQVNATLQTNPTVTQNTAVGVHPILYAVNPSIGPVSGGQPVTLSGDGFLNPSTAVFFNSTTAQVQTIALKSIQAVAPPSPLGGFGDGMVGVNANSLLSLNSNILAYTYVVPGRPYVSFYDSGCQGKQLQLVVNVYDDQGKPVTVPIEITGHNSLMLLNNFWVPSGQTNSGTWITATVQAGTSYTVKNLSPHPPLRRGSGDPYVNTASPAPGSMGCVPVHLLLPKELNQFLPNGGDLPPQPMTEMSVPKGRTETGGERVVGWSNNPDPKKATGTLTGPTGSESAIHVQTVGWEKFRTLMQPPMYLQSSGLVAGVTPGTGTIPVVQAQFSGPIFNISLTGHPEGDIAPLGRDLQLTFGTRGRGGAQRFRIVHLTMPAGQPTWIEDAAEQSYPENAAVIRKVNESGSYALVEIVGMTSEPAPPVQATQPPSQPLQPSQPPAPQPAPANSTILVPSNAFQGGVLTGMVLGPDNQPVPNTPVEIAGGVPVTLTGQVIGDQSTNCAPGDASCHTAPPQTPPAPQTAKSTPPLVNCVKALASSGQPGSAPPAGFPTPGTVPTTAGPILTDAAGRFALCVAPNAPTVAVNIPGGSKATVGTVANQAPPLPGQPPAFFQPGQLISVLGSLGNIVGAQNNNSWRLNSVGAWSSDGQQSITTFQTPPQAQPGNLNLSYTGSDGRSHQVQTSVFKILHASLDRSQLHSNQGASFEYEVQFAAQAGQSLCVEMHAAGPVAIIQQPPETIPVDSAGLGRFGGKIRATQVVPGSAVPFELTPNIHACGQH